MARKISVDSMGHKWFSEADAFPWMHVAKMTSQRFADELEHDADEHEICGICGMSGTVISVGYLLMQILHRCSAASTLRANVDPNSFQSLQQQIGQETVFLVLLHPARRYSHVGSHVAQVGANAPQDSQGGTMTSQRFGDDVDEHEICGIGVMFGTMSSV